MKHALLRVESAEGQSAKTEQERKPSTDPLSPREVVEEARVAFLGLVPENLKQHDQQVRIWLRGLEQRKTKQNVMATGKGRASDLFKRTKDNLFYLWR
ncbi:hypothetical protein VTK73DRAFT_160 [Phialemonium thermophilum]|uniref:Uncharacterized protein n=1 Tax=Phialemonium thermophilum TaxID=223376 RepID=A0ABR3VWP7_9PEZI